MFKIKHFLVINLTLLLLGGCAGTAFNSIEARTGPGGLVSKQVQINDSIMAGTLEFGDLSVKQADEFCMAQVMLINKKKKDVNFEYRFLWYDAAGFEVSPVSAWIPSTIVGLDSRGYQSTAPVKDAVRFRFMVRKPNPISDMGS